MSPPDNSSWSGPQQSGLKLQGNLLTISAERKASREVLVWEIGYGSFKRALTLPEGVDAEKINSEFNKGLLEITVPVTAAALPRQVAIKSQPKAA